MCCPEDVVTSCVLPYQAARQQPQVQQLQRRRAAAALARTPSHSAADTVWCLGAVLCDCMQVLSDHDRPAIEKRVESIIKDNQRFQRVVVSRDEALGMFQENKFKVSKQQPHAAVSVSRCRPPMACSCCMQGMQCSDLGSGCWHWLC